MSGSLFYIYIYIFFFFFFLGGGGGEFPFQIIFFVIGGCFVFLGDIVQNFFIFCGGTLLIFVPHSLIPSHNFFVYLGEV